MIFHEGRVLAMRRAADKDAGPGLWETLSGRIEDNEEPFDAVQREIAEECALQVALDPHPFTAYQAKRNGEAMIVIVYRAEYRSGEVIRSSEHDAHAWLSPDAFAARSPLSKLVEAVRRAARVQ